MPAVPSTCQTTFMTTMLSQTKGRFLTSDISGNRKAITIDYTENPTSLDHSTRFKTLKRLLNNGINPAMDAHFTALQNMSSEKMERILNQRMQVLANTQAEAMHQVVD